MEQEVAIIIESLGFQVETHRAFEDQAEFKSREIDVWASKRFYMNEEHNYTVTIQILCECKNNSSPYVFLMAPKNERERTFMDPSEFLFPIQNVNRILSREPDGRPNKCEQLPAFMHLNLASNHYYYSQEQKVIQICKIVRKGQSWEANHAGICNSIFYPIVKAVQARQHETSDWFKCIKNRDLNFTDSKIISLFFPLVVLSGEIYTLDFLDSQAMPQPSSNVTFVRELRSKTCCGKYGVDFVKLSGLKDFIESKIIPFAEAVTLKTQHSPYDFLTRAVDAK